MTLDSAGLEAAAKALGEFYGGRMAEDAHGAEAAVRAYLAAVVPVTPTTENPYRGQPLYLEKCVVWDEGWAAGRAAATPDPPKDAHRPWPIAPDTVMPPRRQPVRWGSRADDPPTEIHNDPQTTKAYLAGLAAGRTEAAASPDERLREALDNLLAAVTDVERRGEAGLIEALDDAMNDAADLLAATDREENTDG